MNTAKFISELSDRLQFPEKKIEGLMSSLVEVITKQLEDGKAVSIATFGTFESKKRIERVCVNPSTGKRTLIPPKLVVSYKPAPTLKDKIKEG